jgi:hypothetical protein
VRLREQRSLGFSNPPPGSRVPLTLFTVTGFWFDDGAPPPIPGGVFTLQALFVRFGLGGQNIRATVNQDGTWSVAGTLPAGTPWTR